MGAQDFDRLLGRGGDPHIQQKGAEIAGLEPGLQRRQIHAHFGGCITVDGAAEHQFGRTGRQGTGPRRPARFAAPRSGARVAVDDRQNRDRAAPLGLVGLVGGGLIVGGVGAIEQFAVRLARHDQDDRPCHIQIAIVVPAPLGRMDAVTGEDDGRVRHLTGRRIVHSAQGEVRARDQGSPLRRRTRPGQSRLALGRQPLQVNDLQPLAIRTARLHPHGFILSLQPVERLLLALSARIAALEIVGADDAYLIRQALGRKVLSRDRACNQQQGGGGAANEAVVHGDSLQPPPRGPF